MSASSMVFNLRVYFFHHSESFRSESFFKLVTAGRVNYFKKILINDLNEFLHGNKGETEKERKHGN